jgi:hypothetical protein
MTLIRSVLLVLLVLLTILIAVPASCSVSLSTQEEIAHLLSQIAQSECQFIRNSKTYSAEQAVEHISNKYNYLKNRIETTEEFIKYAASRSSITGSDYHIRCGHVTITSREWLENQLRMYRKTD